MITKEILKNPHNEKESLHLVSDKKTKNGEDVTLCLDLLNEGYELYSNAYQILNLNDKSSKEEILHFMLDYIEEKIYVKLTTDSNNFNDVLLEVNEELLIDALIDAYDNNKPLFNVDYIKSMIIKISKMLFINLLEDNKIINMSFPMIGYIELYNAENELIATANRFLISSGASVMLQLYEFIGDEPLLLMQNYKCHLYVNDKKIIFKDLDFFRKIHISKKFYNTVCETYKTCINIETGDINKYNESLTIANELIKSDFFSDLNVAKNYLIDNNSRKVLLNYVKKYKLKNPLNLIDIDKFLIEELL